MIKDVMERNVINEISTLFVMIFTSGLMFVMPILDVGYTLRGWKTEEINGIQFELNSILVEKWEGKCYRLVIQRQRRNSGDLDLWEGEYTYRSKQNSDKNPFFPVRICVLPQVASWGKGMLATY